MLAILQIKINPDTKKIPYSWGSIFQGALMDMLDKAYVEYLHNQSLNPYSQYVFFDKEQNTYIWQIATLTQDAKINIIDKIMEKLGHTVLLKHNNEHLTVASKQIIKSISYKEFVDNIYLKEPTRIKNIKLLTPTTYKSNNDYQIFPSVKALYTSVYNKWNLFSNKISLADEEVFEHIITHSLIINYNLKSYKYDLEKVHLNSFIGNFSLLFKGPTELITISQLLLEYGKFAGLGAKTTMGMGGINFE